MAHHKSEEYDNDLVVMMAPAKQKFSTIRSLVAHEFKPDGFDLQKSNLIRHRGDIVDCMSIVYERISRLEPATISVGIGVGLVKVVAFLKPAPEVLDATMTIDSIPSILGDGLRTLGGSRGLETWELEEIDPYELSAEINYRIRTHAFPVFERLSSMDAFEHELLHCHELNCDTMRRLYAIAAIRWLRDGKEAAVAFVSTRAVEFKELARKTRLRGDERHAERAGIFLKWLESLPAPAAPSS